MDCPDPHADRGTVEAPPEAARSEVSQSELSQSLDRPLLILAPLNFLRLTGPRRSTAVRVTFALAIFAVAAWLGGWQVYGWYHWLAGQRSLQANHFRDALQHFRAAIKAWPNNGAASFFAARSARRMGDLELADGYLRQCQTVPSLADQAAFERVLLRASKGEVDEVENYCHALLEQGHPETPLILEALAVGNLTVLRFAAASQAIERWAEISPDDPQVVFLKGRLQLQATNNSEAVEFLRRVVELDPDRDDARSMLAGLHLDLGQAQEAIAHLDVLCQRQPDNVPAQGRRAQALVLLGRSDEAIVLLDEVIRKRPDLASALLERGKLALRDGQLQQAEDWLRQAVQRDPGDRAAHYQLLQCLKQLGKTKEARAVQERLEQIDYAATRLNEIVTADLPLRPVDADLQAELGELLLDVGAVDDGLVWLNRALRLDPRLPRAHRALAKHYRSLGQSSLADQHLPFVDSVDAPR